MDTNDVDCLLQHVLPDFASYGDVELLQRFLVLGVQKIEIVDVCKLGLVSKRGCQWNVCLYLRRMECLTSATLAGV